MKSTPPPSYLQILITISKVKLSIKYTYTIYILNIKYIHIGMENKLFNTVVFWKGVLNGMCQALFITIPTLAILEKDTFI